MPERAKRPSVQRNRERAATAQVAHTQATASCAQVMRDLKAAVAREPLNSEHAKAQGAAEIWIPVQLKATETALRTAEKALTKSESDVETEILKVQADKCLKFGNEQNAATTTAAQGKIAEIDLLAAAGAADLDCPAGIEPRPSRQIYAALDTIVREHFASHLAWLKYDTAAEKLRDVFTKEPRAAAQRTRDEALAVIREQQNRSLEGLITFQNRELQRASLSIGYQILPNSAEGKACNDRGLSAFKDYRRVNFEEPLTPVEATYTATIAELDALPLDTLVERYAAAAKEKLEIEANAAAAAAREIDPTDDEIRSASALLPIDSRSVEQSRQFAQELAANAARDAVIGTSKAPVFAIPERPTCERPANLEHYKELLAPYLADPPLMPSQIQLDCQAECVAKYGTAALSAGAAA